MEHPVKHPPGAHPPPRKRRQIDWELIVCGWKGHHLVGTDAAEIRPQDYLIARDYGPVRWHRCLRCDSWLGLPPPENPRRQHPPDRDEIVVPLRGKALRDRVVLRLIAIDRAFHFVVLVLLGIGVLVFAAHESSLRGTYYRILSDIQRGVAGGPVQTTGHVGILHELDRLFSLRSGTLREVGAALLGLWRARGHRGGRALVHQALGRVPDVRGHDVAAAARDLRAQPRDSRLLKLIGFIINVAVVIYLLYAKRLFGLRGGGAVDEELRAHDVSWEAIERATPPAMEPVSCAR